MPRRKASRPGDDLRVGSIVRYRMPGGEYPAKVVEDLGDLGNNGRRLLMIQPLGEYEDGPFMWPAEELLPPESKEELPGCRFRVGARVVYQTPHVRFDAEVVEDCGNVGKNGRRLYAIRSVDDYEDARITLEVPAKDLMLAE